MRTTLSIDDDLAQSIEAHRSRKNMSLREAINQLLRLGLQTAKEAPKPRPYAGPVFDSELMPGIDPRRMNQLVDELEVEAHRP